jgi:hypothetical protein
MTLLLNHPHLQHKLVVGPLDRQQVSQVLQLQ